MELVYTADAKELLELAYTDDANELLELANEYCILFTLSLEPMNVSQLHWY